MHIEAQVANRAVLIVCEPSLDALKVKQMWCIKDTNTTLLLNELFRIRLHNAIQTNTLRALLLWSQQRMFCWQVARYDNTVELARQICHVLASFELWEADRTICWVFSHVFRCKFVVLLLFKWSKDPSEARLQTTDHLFGKTSWVDQPTFQKATVSAKVARKAEKEEAGNE